jgi:hypothetical protein
MTSTLLSKDMTTDVEKPMYAVLQCGDDLLDLYRNHSLMSFRSVVSETLVVLLEPQRPGGHCGAHRLY